MRLPSLRVSIPFIFLCWCLVGVQVHGLVILAYPAMWALVGLFFYLLHVLIKAPAQNTDAQAEAATAKSDSSSAVDEANTDHQIPASV